MWRDAIAEAYAAAPPDDEIRLVGPPRLGDATVESDDAWAAQGGRAARMTLTVRDGGSCRLVVSSE